MRTTQGEPAGAAGRRALIIGGSVGGLFTALLLRRAGWSVQVFERSEGDLAGRGAGINTTPELFALMRRCGVEHADTSGVPLHGNRCWDAAGREIGRMEFAQPRIASIWSHVYRPLRRALPDECYHPGMACTAVQAGPASVQAIFANGARAEGDLLVAADGVQSTVRRQMLPNVQPQYSGYVLWRFVISEAEVDRAAHTQLAGHLNFALPPGELVLCFLIPGRHDDLRPGHRNFCVVWYRPAAPETTLPDLLTDASGRRHFLSIPAALIRLEIIRALKAAADATLPPAIAEIIQREPQPLLQTIVDLEVPRLVFGRTVLLGDAAFVARPHVAAGVTKAALDAACLVDSLAAAADNADAALAHYERERLRVGRLVVQRGRELGAYLSAQTNPAVPAAEAERARTPESVMREYGLNNLGGISLVSPAYQA